MTETSTTTAKPCEIVAIDRHDPDGVTVEWAVRDLWAEKFKADGFDSSEEAIEWAERNGYTPNPAASTDDLTAGTSWIHVYYLGCGHVTWLVDPPQDPPAAWLCRSCSNEVAVVCWEGNQVNDGPAFS
jgi:hypothetical protein